MGADLDRLRRELGTDYIDTLLLHCMMDTHWPEHKKGRSKRTVRNKSNDQCEQGCGPHPQPCEAIANGRYAQLRRCLFRR